LNDAVLNQLANHAPCKVARYGESDTLIAAARRDDPGIDTDKLTSAIDKRTA
jgi:hypothetical protein